MSYNQIFPLSTKDKYRANDIVDFLLAFEDKQILQNSIRLTGKLRVDTSTNIGDDSQTPTRVAAGTDLAIDGTVGIHGAFQSITCSCDNLGVIENQNEYPRYLKAKSSATQTAQQLFTDSQNTTELKCGRNEHTRYIFGGNEQSTLQDLQIPFSFKPDVAFNKSSSHIGYKKTGGLKLSFRLATDAQFLFGDSATNHSYALYDLRLEYQSLPDSTSGDIVFETIHMVKTTAESNNTSISTRVPSIVQSVSMVFHKDSQLNTAVYNHLQLEVPPDVQRCEFSFNDSTTAYYNFALESEEEILLNYQRSWGVAAGAKSNITLSLLNKNESYGIGMPFGTYLDMSKGSKFGVNLLSNIQSTMKYGVFMYFRGIVKV